MTFWMCNVVRILAARALVASVMIKVVVVLSSRALATFHRSASVRTFVRELVRKLAVRTDAAVSIAIRQRGVPSARAHHALLSIVRG